MNSPRYTAFDGHRRIASGSLHEVALAVRRANEHGASGPVLIFDDASGRSVDIDMRGSDEELMARLAPSTTGEQAAPAPDAPQTEGDEAGEPRGRGRPKLGVIAREVTLLPRHWEWLASQPGGASVVLRKLVEEARRASAQKDKQRAVQERAYHFMSALAGDLPGFEEAIRALFASDLPRLRELIAPWPENVRHHVLMLADGETPSVP